MEPPAQPRDRSRRSRPLPVAGRIDFAGSIKWIGSTFDRHDLETLRHSSSHIPGYETGRSELAVVSLSGTDIDTDDK